MALGATFDPQGGGSRQSLSVFGDAQSLMQRADANARENELMNMRRAEFELTLPVRQETLKADLLKAKTSLDEQTKTQIARQSAYQMKDQADTDFNFLMQIQDDKVRAHGAAEWLGRYSQLANIAELSQEFKTKRDLATSLIQDSMKLDALTPELRTFNSLTKGLDVPDKNQAARIKLGLDHRESSAAIQYKTVTGPDGVPRLVAVDPRDVGARVVGSGEAYGSGVGPIATPPKDATATPTGVDQGKIFAGQTPEQVADAKHRAELIKARPKREAALHQAQVTTQRMADDIDALITKVSSATAGPGGIILGAFPGTTATDFQANLDNIKANIGFQALQAMREASPTGGALGAVSDYENRALQSTIASLGVGQSPSQLIENLKKVKQRTLENAGLARSAFESEYRELGDAPATRPAIKELSTEQLESRLRELRANRAQ